MEGGMRAVMKKNIDREKNPSAKSVQKKAATGAQRNPPAYGLTFIDQPVQRKENKTTMISSTPSQQVVQRVQWSPAANRAPLDEIRDYEAGTPGHRPYIGADKLRDFKKVQDILDDNNRVSQHMGNLNTKIESIMAQRDNKLTYREAMLSVLRAAERRQGYSKEGIIDADSNGPAGARKLSELGKAGKAFQDFGVSAVQHGPDTHRIQQYILYRENKRRQQVDAIQGTNHAFENPGGALGVYKDMANYRYGVHTNDYQLNQHSPGRQGRSKIYAWELLLDRVNGKTGVDSLDHHTMQPLQPDAGYPIHLMEAMRLGNYGTGIQNAALEAKPASDKHIKELDQGKLMKTRAAALLGGVGLGAIASLGFGVAGLPLLLTAGAGALGGYMFGKNRWK